MPVKRQNIQPDALAKRVVNGHVLYSHVVSVAGTSGSRRVATACLPLMLRWWRKPAGARLRPTEGADGLSFDRAPSCTLNTCNRELSWRCALAGIGGQDGACVNR